MTEKRMEPRHPSPLEKKTNIQTRYPGRRPPLSRGLRTEVSSSSYAVASVERGPSRSRAASKSSGRTEASALRTMAASAAS
jgi:hypothetical protein